MSTLASTGAATRVACTGAVLCGGAAGALCRYKLNAAIMGLVGSALPAGILCCNVLGCLLMGLLQGALQRSGKPFTVGYCLLGTGFLGGFTTFSSFSLNTFTLMHTGELPLALCNIILNAALCLGAVWLGYRLVSPRVVNVTPS